MHWKPHSYGTLELHVELESRIAAFCGCEAALVFTTGYQASLAIVAALGHPMRS